MLKKILLSLNSKYCSLKTRNIAQLKPEILLSLNVKSNFYLVLLPPEGAFYPLLLQWMFAGKRDCLTSIRSKKCKSDSNIRSKKCKKDHRLIFLLTPCDGLLYKIPDGAVALSGSLSSKKRHPTEKNG